MGASALWVELCESLGMRFPSLFDLGVKPCFSVVYHELTTLRGVVCVIYFTRAQPEWNKSRRRAKRKLLIRDIQR